MELNEAFALALKELRGRAKRSQFDFAPTVSREYISLLERAQRWPSLEKIDEISSVLGIHALSLVAKCYLHKNPDIPLSELLRIISEDLQDQSLESSKNSSPKGTS
ncbi:helix-turn-helix transcriptional regulator [Pseudomonas moraviensis]|uniref:helix-turn-helix transcriptional regulator n=1 Tax=Pseudomonas moraviensis TaxID=321662 RepID=UPI000F796DC6|nr:helix-turn-helix transcriptional regulator [Pseudomonas moraviensis]RRW54947.1 XRE family transcriptional regulator [Pseudomonas moraviensis]